MGNSIFKYLIPVYVVWFVVHMVFFFTFIFNQIISMENGNFNFSGFGILMLSHFLLIILAIAFIIYMIVDCALRKFEGDSEKIIWIMVIVFLSVFGAIIYYYIYGKNSRK